MLIIAITNAIEEDINTIIKELIKLLKGPQSISRLVHICYDCGKHAFGSWIMSKDKG